MADLSVTANDAIVLTDFESEFICPYSEVNLPSVVAKRLVANSAWAIPFVANLRSDNISGCKAIKASPGAGYRIMVQQMIVSSDTALNISIGEGVADSGVTTPILGPIQFAVSQPICWKFKHPIALTANTALVCDANGAGNVNIFVEGLVV